MKPGRLRRFAERLRQRMLPASRARREHEVAQEISKEFTTEELEEFLEGDLRPLEVDPAFKERLRQELWEMMQQRYGRGGGDRLD